VQCVAAGEPGNVIERQAGLMDNARPAVRGCLTAGAALVREDTGRPPAAQRAA